MREAASRGFWMGSSVPYGYGRLMVQDGAKKRPRLELDPTTAPIVKRIFDMSEAGSGLVDITAPSTTTASPAPLESSGARPAFTRSSSTRLTREP